MAVINKDDITQKGSERLRRELQHLIDQLDARTNDPNNFITITELEELWSTAASNTSYIYSNTLSEAISNIDEKELIKSKKESSAERGSN